MIDRVPVSVAADYALLCEGVAARIAALIQDNPRAVLGLATGSTPTGVYAALVRRHRTEGLDFSGVTCFNLDEYYPMGPADPRSYHAFMQTHLFDHVNCRHWHVPDGRPRSEADVAQHCREYEARIAAAGGIDFQLLGIGRTGHIGFNEPGSGRDSRTRLVELDSRTREDAAGEFEGIENVPHRAVTMGVGTILAAREIVLMASGAGKAGVVQAAVTSDVSERLPASLVRLHPRAHFFLDRPAASALVTGSGGPGGKAVAGGE